MVTKSRPDATCFSLPQLETIMAWGAAKPHGFGVRIMTDHEDYPELAELYKHDKMSPLWFLSATQAGTAVITKASGADEELDTVEQALALVLVLDRLASNATWPKRSRTLRDWRQPLQPEDP